MTKHTHLALLCAAVIVGLLISPAMAAVAAPGENIYRGLNAAQNRPDIDGNVIVWDDDRDGNAEIYLGTVDEFRRSLGYSGERITNNPASQEKPSISGDYIAWQDDRDGDREIYLYQRSTGEETRLTENPDDQGMPIVRGNYVAWYDSNSTSGRTNVVLYDIAAADVKAVIDCNAKTTIPYGSTEFKPALSENYVAWVEEEDWKVHYYDIAAEAMVGPVSPGPVEQSWPWLSGSLIAWEDYRHGGSNAEIYMTDLDNPSIGEQRITNAPGYQISPAISGNIITWEDMRDGNRSIYMYDLSTDEEMSVYLSTNINDEQLYPAASGNTIVWQRGASPNSNLYIFVYEPGAVVEPVASTVTVAPETATLAINGTQQFEATVLDQSGKPMSGIEVTWTSSDEAVGTIDETGLFTAVADGTATITATAENVTGEATVTVTAEELPEPALDSIRIAPATATLAINGTQQFTATALDQSGKPMSGIEVTWTSSDEAVGTIDADGLFTAVAEGTANVTATAENVTGEATVTVIAGELPEPAAERITINPLTATATVNETVNFTATVYDQFEVEMPEAAVTWISSNETIGTIDETGLFTAVTAGITAVTATAGNASASALVTVEAPAEPVLESIAVTPETATLAIGDTQRFIVTALDQAGNAMTGVNVTWTSSDEAVGTIDANGAFAALAEGTATVTATAGNITEEATVTVISNEPALASIAVTPSEITLGSGDTATFTATALDQFGDAMTGIEVAWTSSDEAVGTIGADGVFSAAADGTTTVTASAGNMTGTAAVTVTTGTSGVVISPATITLGAGESRQFTATVYDLEGNATPGADVTWTSSDEAVGTIDADGLFTAVADGTATITATAENETGTATVTVESSPVATRIAVEPATATVLPGATRAFTATVFDQRDNTMDWIRVTWASSDMDVGTIDRAGLFGAFAEGSADVTASAGEAAGTAAVTVSATAVPDPNQGGNGGSSSGGSDGGSSEPTFSAATCENLKSGETFTFSELTTTSVGSVNVTAAGTIPQMMLTVKKAKAPSAAEPLAGDVYEYVEITPYWVNPSLIGTATVFFSVPTDWLEVHNATAEDVGLMHYAYGTWEPLETEVIGEENGRYNFRATTPGFSIFAIVASPVSVTASAVEVNATTEATETPTVTETPVVTENVTTEPTTAAPATTPAAPLVYAPLLAPLAFFLWARRRP